MRGELAKALVQEADQFKNAELPPQTGLQEENVFAPQPDIAAKEAAKARKEQILKEFNHVNKGGVDEKTPPSNDPKDMGKADAIKDAAAILYREFPATHVDKVLEPLEALAASSVGAGTDDPATEKLRPKRSPHQIGQK